MIKNVYGYVYDISTGMMTSIPKAYIDMLVFTNETNKPWCILHDPKPDGKQYSVSHVEGTVKETANQKYTIWFKEPNPIKAKQAINDYIYEGILAQERKYEKELEKLRKQKQELFEKVNGSLAE